MSDMNYVFALSIIIDYFNTQQRTLIAEARVRRKRAGDIGCRHLFLGSSF